MPKNRTLFTKRFAGKSGIGELMDDLGQAMASGDKLMLGGGNPGYIPEVATLWRDRLNEMVNSSNEIDSVLGNYDTPQGNENFINSIVSFFNRHFNFGITRENVVITNGSQCAMFNLLNILGGTGEDGVKRKILFPLVPEYIGYADQHLEDDVFLSLKPIIEDLGFNRYKYRIDRDNLNKIKENLGALCVSRPTNPTGNVLTNDEIDFLHLFSKKRGIPLIIDNAYGAPFPQILFKDITLKWDENIVLSMSLSKIGLPSTRTGIVVANREIVLALSRVNAITSLASGSLGQGITYPMLDDDRLINISKNLVKPFYQKRSNLTLELMDKYFQGIDYKVHVSEGALFLWVWFPSLPITSKELYTILKEKNVLIIPGNYFFFGLKEYWDHSDQCIRINYSGEERVVKEGIRIIGKTIKGL